MLEVIKTNVGTRTESVRVDVSIMPDLISFAKDHAVIGLLCHCCELGLLDIVSDENTRQEKMRAVATLAAFEQKQKETKSNYDRNVSDVLGLLLRENIPFVVFKGPAAASYYPAPQIRSIGDLDFYVPQSSFDSAVNLFEKELGVKFEKDRIDKHFAFSYNGTRFEMHYRVETFGNSRNQKEFDRYIDDLLEIGDLDSFEITPGLFVPKFRREFESFVVFKHFCCHFLGSGVGLRQLTDLAMIRCHPTFDFGYARMIRCVETVLGKYLDIEEFNASSADEKLADRMMNDILKSGNFGKSDYSHRKGVLKRAETGMKFWSNALVYGKLAPSEIFGNLFLRSRNSVRVSLIKVKS